jgi:Ca-activated chloride channel family protein
MALAGPDPALAQGSAPDDALRPEVNLVAPQAWARARGVRRLDAPVEVSEVIARVRVVDQVATTRLLVRLHNPAPRQQEAELLLPVPEGATVRGFDFEGGAAEPTARLLSVDEAKKAYRSIVARMRDPALLEFASYGAIRSSVFPVPAGGDQAITVTFEHLCPRDGGRVDYILPRTQVIAESTVDWTMAVEIATRTSLSTVYSPTHPIEFSRVSETGGTVRIEGGSTRDPGPFHLSWLTADRSDQMPASLLACPDRETDGGYFLLLAGLPARIDAERTVDREVTLVLDRSGSMRGRKIEQARAAARQVIQGLRPGEAFNIIAYSNGVARFSARPVIKTEKTMAEALAYLDSIQADGGTNLHDAVVEAVRQAPTGGKLPLVLLLSDGLPTVGVTGEVAIRDAVAASNVAARRIYTFGVGTDVNVPLLDRLSERSRGTLVTVLPREDVEVKVSSLFQKLEGPVLASPRLETVGPDGQVTTRRVHDLQPQLLPDLFRGDQLVLTGRYRGDEPLRFRLHGQLYGKPRLLAFDLSLERATVRNTFVARLWASRRIASLIDDLRQQGVLPGDGDRELVDEIVRLSTDFGILTEYTAFLSLEGTDLSADPFNGAVALDNIERAAVRNRSGKHAVSQQGNVSRQRDQDCWNGMTNNRWNDENEEQVSVDAVQTMGNRAFYRRGHRWVDGAVLAEEAEPEVDEVVPFGSPRFEEVFRALIREASAGVLALGDDTIVRVGDKVIRITFGTIEEH